MDNSRLVDFIIAGTQKGGTSALDAYLRGHPEICMARIKEPHFFDSETHFQNTPADYSVYHAFFEPRPGQRLGEATPAYMYWHDAPRRMWEYNPALKIILLLRNPVTRAYSHWNMIRRDWDEPLSFHDALRREAERCRTVLPLQHLFYSYQDRGFYTEQLRRLWRFFPRAQVLVLKSEHLRTSPREVLDRVCGFIGVAKLESIVPQEVRVHVYERDMAPEDKAWLKALYEYEIKSLERMLGWDCKEWLDI